MRCEKGRKRVKNTNFGRFPGREGRHPIGYTPTCGSPKKGKRLEDPMFGLFFLVFGQDYISRLARPATGPRARIPQNSCGDCSGDCRANLGWGAGVRKSLRGLPGDCGKSAVSLLSRARALPPAVSAAVHQEYAVL